MERSEATDVAGILRSVPLFGAVSADELVDLTAAARTRSLARGDKLFREGDPAVSCFVVLAGEVDVVTGGREGVPVQRRRLGTGELFGELGVLLGRARTATVVAARPAQVLEIPAEPFRHMVTTTPLALEQVSHLLATRLVATTRGDRTSTTPRVVAVTGESGAPGRSLVAATVAAMLHDVTDRTTAWVEVVTADEEGSVTVAAVAADASAVPTGPTGWSQGTRHLRLVAPSADADLSSLLPAAVEHLRRRFTFVVLDLHRDREIAPALLADVADVQVHVSHRLSLPPAVDGLRRLVVLNLHDDRAHPIPVNSSQPFVLRADAELADLSTEAAAEAMVHDPWMAASRTLGRLVRTLLGTTVGVALGGGAAFSLAHIGVLEVLDANGVPVDVIVGTSMGSLVATGYAAGIRPDAMREVAIGIGGSLFSLATMLDLNPMRPGVLSGRKLQQTFNPMLGDVQHFEDLLVPCRTVAADIESGERICIGTGRLEDAFRASSSVPLLVAPWLHEGRALVDGAMVDPVPAEVTREMGADLAIAVNVVPHLRRGVTNVVSRMMRQVSTVNPLSIATRSRGLPNLVDTAMNTIQALQHELGHFKAASADVRINPDLADVTWVEFYKAATIIERGRAAGEEALPGIRRVLAERLAAALPD